MFFFNDTATTEIYTYLHTLSLHDALPILHLQPATRAAVGAFESVAPLRLQAQRGPSGIAIDAVAVPHTHVAALAFAAGRAERRAPSATASTVAAAASMRDRKSTRLNSSH